MRAGKTANALVEDAKRAADETLAAHDRMTNSWDRFKVNQDATVAAMNENSISFEDVIKGLASDFGISTTEMANKAIGMGVTYNDTMALMEAFGREKIAGIVRSLFKLGEATKKVTGIPPKKFLGYASLSARAQEAFRINLRAGNAGQNDRILETGREQFGSGGGTHVTIELDGEVFNEAVASANTQNGRRGVD